MKKLVILACSTATLAAIFEASGLSPRDTTPVACSDVGLKTCGTVCIEQSATCCPDQTGGCPVGSVCWLGDNKQYGCCPEGETCKGSGGSDITTHTIQVDTNSVTIAGTTPSGDVETTAAATTTPSGTGAVGTVTTAPNTSAKSRTTGAASATSSRPLSAGAAVSGLGISGLLGVVLVVSMVCLGNRMER